MPRRTASGTLLAATDDVLSVQSHIRERDPIHTMVGGYRIESTLGRGGMSSVYLAVHPVLRTSAAVKVLHHDLSARSDLSQRFISEARAVAALRHPHIVQIFDFVTLPDGRLAIVMEFLDGVTLESHAGTAPMQPARARSILLQLCSALAMAHHRGIVHRDLKAQNVVMVNAGAQDYVKLLDFGLMKFEAQLESGLTVPGMVLGTPHYMAPEQVRGEAVDRRTDVYALGVLAFRLLAGTVPFDGTPSQVMFHHLQTTPPPLTSVPADLREVVVKATAKRPEDRFQTMVEFARALRACELDPVRKAASKPLPFTARVEGTSVFLRFSSESAFLHIQQYDLSRGRLFIPGEAPRVPGLLRLIAEVPGREPTEAPATLLGIFDQRAAEKHGIPVGFAVTLRGRFGPQTTSTSTVAPSATIVPGQPRQRRLAHRLPVTFAAHGTVALSGVTTNVSERGLGIVSPHLMSVGSMLTICIELPSGGSAHLRGAVAWSKETAHRHWKSTLGIRLTQVDDAYQSFIRSHARGAPLEAASGISSLPPSIDIDLSDTTSDDSMEATEKVWVRGAGT
jgi:serine/threonine protein kinase